MASIILHLAKFARERSGAGAIEFALIVPLLLVLYIGGVDTTRAIVFSHKVQNATASVNDLVCQATELTKDAVVKIFGAADAILSGYSPGTLNLRVTAIEIDATGNAKVAWSVVRGMERASTGKSYALPENLKSLRSYTLIVTESAVDFVPLSEMVIRTKIPLSAQSQGRFRGRKAVICTDCSK